MEKLILIDGMVLIFRAHYAFVKNPRLTGDGRNVSVEFGFINTLLGVLEKEDPTHIAVAFDTDAPTKRHIEYPAYKAQRSAIPENLITSIPQVYELLEALRIKVFTVDGFEADDIIGTISRCADELDFKTYMVTTDKDFSQLVSEKTYFYKLSAHNEKIEIMGVPEIKDKWQVSRIDQVTDILGLWGDSSDNIPGVTGIGEKTAQKLITQFGSIENLVANTDQLKGKQKENLENETEQALLSKRLATIDRHVPIPVDFDGMKRQSPNLDKLKAIFTDLEFDRLGKRIIGEEFSVNQESSVSTSLRTIKDVKYDYRIADTIETRESLIKKLKSQQAFCLDCETTGLDPKTAKLVGIAFSFKSGTGFYVPIPNTEVNAQSALQEFRPLLEDESIGKVNHNLKFDLAVLKWHGITVRGKLFDTMLAHQLIFPDLRHNLDFLAKTYLSYSPISYSNLTQDSQMDLLQIPIQRIAEYASEDADITWQLYEFFKDLISEKELSRVFYEVECPLVPVLVEIESNGVKLDSQALISFSSDLKDELFDKETEIYRLARMQFNIDSPKQLGEVLFDHLKLAESPRKTKTGQYKTDAKVLESLAPNHQIAQQLLEFREVRRLKNTYVDTLPKAIFERTQRIHTEYDQAFVATGRIQSHSPNLQNIPIRTKRGKEIRKAFIPRSDEYVLLSADYSQIELRIIAELSGDENLITAFEVGLDIHTETASKVFQVPYDQVNEEMRRQAKMVNFGIVYGISAFGLAQRLGIRRGDAQQIIDRYFNQFPKIRNYMDDIVEFARNKGYVQTMTGRRRYLPDVNSANVTMRNSAERNAINSPIQGSSADLIKLAMSAIYQEFTSKKLKTRMILQVHDELLFDMWKSEEETVVPIVQDKMQTAIPMSVPLKVDIGIGHNWLEAH